MNTLKKLMKIGINIPVNLDKAVAKITKKLKLWSDWYSPGKTISWSFGAEEAETLYALWVHDRKICNTFPYISLKDHPLGQFSEDLCNFFQSYHGLKTFLKDPSVLEKKYPGITEVVKLYLKTKGITV